MERNGGGGRIARFMRTALGCLLVAACVFSGGVSAQAFGDEPAADSPTTRIVRVAFPQQARSTWMSETGVRSGYTYEFLERIAQYTGWDYEFVPVEGDEEAALEASRALLESGEVDLVAGVMASEGEDALALTRESYATLEAVLLADAERPDDPLLSDDGERPVRVAMTERSAFAEDAEAFFSRNGLAYEVAIFPSSAEACDSLLAGKADVMLASDQMLADGLRIVAHVASRPLFFAAAIANRALLDELDAALARIDDVDPRFRQRLHEAYFARMGGPLVLSESDRAFIASVGSVRVGVLADEPPYQDMQDGQAKGISVDVLNMVAEKTGLAFEFVAAASEAELDELLAQGAVDMAACVDYDYEAARARGLSLSQPYVTAACVLVANEGAYDGDLAGKRLALPSSGGYEGELAGEAALYPSTEACLRAVADGEADYTYVDEFVMQHYLGLPEYRGLRASPQTHEPHRVSFGVARTGDGTLLGIVDRAVGSLSEVELQAAVNRNVMDGRPGGVVDFLRAHPLETFAAAAVVLLIVLLLVLVIVYQRSRANAKTAFELKKRLRLYALCDDYFFEFDKRTETLLMCLPVGGRRGEAESTVVSMDPSSFTLDDERKAAFLDVLRADEGRVAELRLPDADGIEHWLRISVEPVDVGRAACSVGKIEVIDDERLEKDQLVAKAEHDSLTGLLNSETTRRRVDGLLAALGPDERGALLMVDIDHFKDVNDTYGHLEGDHVLVGVAHILRESFRIGDVVGRLGGDEFMVYLNRADVALVEERSEAVRRAVERHAFEESSCRITISTGAAFSRAGEVFDDLYRRADEVLYEAKRQGRNRCGFSCE